MFSLFSSFQKKKKGKKGFFSFRKSIYALKFSKIIIKNK